MQSWNSKKILDTRPTLFVGVRGGVGLVWIGKRPTNAKVFQDFCPWLYVSEVLHHLECCRDGDAWHTADVLAKKYWSFWDWWWDQTRYKCVQRSFKHPARQADCGGSAPYWPGVASLEAGGSCPLGHDDPSNRRRQPVPPGPTSIGLSL